MQPRIVYSRFRPSLHRVSVEGNKTVKEILFKDELQLEFILNVGIVKDSELSMPYRTKLSNDKWNLFLPVQGFEDILLGFLKEGEDVREAISVTVYDKGGHEFDMMLKKSITVIHPKCLKNYLIII